METEETFIGIELEFTPEIQPDDFEPTECWECGHVPESWEDSYIQQFEVWEEENEGGNVEAFLYSVGNVDRWELKTDSSCGLEWVLARPLPLLDAVDAFHSLRDAMEYESYNFNRSTGMHVHIDCRPDEPGAIDPEIAWDLWCNHGFAEQAWALNEHSWKRESNAYCPIVPRDQSFQEVMRRSLRGDFNVGNLPAGRWRKGSLELRMWDCTFDTDIINRRFQFLQNFIDACHSHEIMPVWPMGAAAFVWFATWGVPGLDDVMDVPVDNDSPDAPDDGFIGWLNGEDNGFQGWGE